MKHRKIDLMYGGEARGFTFSSQKYRNILETAFGIWPCHAKSSFNPICNIPSSRIELLYIHKPQN